jgi:hypothetical protein
MQWRPMTLDLVSNLWPRRKSAARRDTLAPYFRHGFWGRHKFLTSLVLALIGVLYGFIFGLTQTYFLVEMLIPAAILAFIAIGLLPENGRAHQRTITFLFFAFITVLAVWPDYLALTLPGLPWVTAIRLVGMPLSLVFLISLSQSKTYRTSLTRVLSDSGLIWPFLLTYFVLVAVTLPLSATPINSLNKLIVSLYSWLAICLVAICIFQTPSRVRQFAQLLWATTLISCFVGLQEYRLSAVPWAGHIPSFLTIEDPTIARILSGVVRAALGEHRVQGKFTTPLSFAEFLALVMPFLIHFMIAGRGYVERIAAAVTIPLVIFIIIATDSRLGVIGLILTVFGYLFFWAVNRWRRERKSILAPVIVIGYPVMSGLFLLSTFFVGRLRNAVWGSGAYQASNEARETQLADGLAIIAQSPWGHGIGRAAETLGYTDLEGFLTIDSYYLSVALEVGVIGFIAYYGAFVLSIWGGVRVSFEATKNEQTAWLVPTTLALINYVVIKSVLSQQENHPIAFALLGLAMALTHQAKKAASGAPNSAPL